MNILNYKQIPQPHEVVNQVKENGYLICNNVIDDKIVLALQNFWINRFINTKQSKLKNITDHLFLDLEMKIFGHTLTRKVTTE